MKKFIWQKSLRVQCFLFCLFSIASSILLLSIASVVSDYVVAAACCFLAVIMGSLIFFAIPGFAKNISVISSNNSIIFESPAVWFSPKTRVLIKDIHFEIGLEQDFGDQVTYLVSGTNKINLSRISGFPIEEFKHFVNQRNRDMNQSKNS